MFGRSKPSHSKEPVKAKEAVSYAEGTIFARLKNGLSKTRGRVTAGVQTLVLGGKAIDQAVLDDVEGQLLSADVGLEATDQIVGNLREKLDRRQLSDGEAFLAGLKQELQEILKPSSKPLQIPESEIPFLLLVVGVNGVGKTTTIGKLAKKFQAEGRSVMLAAGDTFRAAAVEQLQAWGEHNNVPVVAQAIRADSASVIFDAAQSAKARNIDVLIADTAGRLHTKENLMIELEKIVRVLKKQDERFPHEIMLVLDATTGQNALNQAESFNKTTTLSGITLTKLDGTAKGGVVFSLAKRLGLPNRLI
ncbi:MAG: signal recognition particle-docking protein FtsY [Pseudomonadota bacterium]|nr:signal recognition particle-docking protein FtsY [Pseudomonadota bacterium]